MMRKPQTVTRRAQSFARQTIRNFRYMKSQPVDLEYGWKKGYRAALADVRKIRRLAGSEEKERDWLNELCAQKGGNTARLK